jgi:hypothetical protein
MSVMARVIERLGHRSAPVGRDELAATRALGYSRRADHPWGVPPALNQTRAPVVQPAGACGERSEVFEGARDFTQ